MATTVGFANATRTGMLNAITTAIGAVGLVRIYAGTRPATCDTATSSNTVLAELPMANPAAPDVTTSTYVWTASAITQDTTANATDVASWARVWGQTGSTVAVFDVDVATSGAGINLNTTQIVSGGPVQITAFTITLPNP